MKAPIPPEPRELTEADLSRISPKIPTYLKVLYADALMAFADMEHALNEVMWAWTGINEKHGKLLADMNVSKKVGIVRALVEEDLTDEEAKGFRDLWSNLSSLIDTRNHLAHGTAYTLDYRSILMMSRKAKKPTDQNKAVSYDRTALTDMRDASQGFVRLFVAMAQLRRENPERAIQPTKLQERADKVQ